jgi:DNA repair exonuclease SbcCD ATPase subunit
MTNQAQASKINVSEEAYSAIYAALDQVFAQTAKKPKYSEVQAIYKTSNSYIQHVMADWVDKHQDDLNKPIERPAQAIALSDETIKSLSNSFLLEVQRAKDEAEAELDQERKALYEIRDESLDEMQAQMQIADERLDEINNFVSDKAKQDQKVLQLEQGLAESKATNDDLVSVNKRQNDDIQHAKNRNNALEQELTDTRKQLNTAQSETTSYKMQFDEVSKRAERLTTELDAKAKQLNERDDTISKLSTESLDDKRMIATLQGNNEALKQSNDTLEHKLSKSSDDLKQANDESSVLKGNIAQLTAEHQALTTTHSNTAKALELAKQQIADLQNDNEKLKKSSK